MFPAYQPSLSKADDEGSDTKETNQGPKLSWLVNKSFPSLQETGQENIREGESNEKYIKHKSHKKKLSNKHSKKKKKLQHREKKRVELNILEGDPFFEDRKQERGNFLVSTLHRPAVPKYDKNNQYFKRHKIHLRILKKKKKSNRYFSTKNKNEEGHEINKSSGSLSKEEELTKVTERFNQQLAENPHDVNCVLEYVNFQDTMYQFERMYRNNSSGGERVMVERKLAILERALERNPASEPLLAEKLQLSERITPAEQLAEECNRALIQDPSNLSLWRTLVRTSRNTMARCTAPGVLQLFSKAITRIGQLKLHRPTSTVEHDVLGFLVECGLFLQQAGLYEQLWTLLQMYLGLSLTASGQFHIPAPPQGDKLEEEEDRVMASGLPLSELWVRVERLRAGSHFLPDNTCESDPQRVVFTDDMAGLLQPVMSPECRLKLVVSTLVLLKVPLLPTSHALLECLGLLQVSSTFNDAESLLPCLLLRHISACAHHDYLSGAVELITEPQYVRSQHSQQLYLDWLLSVMQHCADLLPPAEAVLIHVWKLRLLALLCRLHKLGLSPSATITKLASSQAKKLLKQPQWRENLTLYVEYALIERNAGDLSKAVSVLETALSMSGSLQSEHQTPLCRSLVECLLAQDYTANRQHALKTLRSLSTTNSPAWWQEETTRLLSCHEQLIDQALSVEAAMTPHPLTDWLACHAYHTLLSQSVLDAVAMLQRCVDQLSCSPDTLGKLWVEQIYEIQVDILSAHTFNSKSSFSLLRSVLSQALSCFPNNLTLLNTLAVLETRQGGGGTPMWKLVKLFPDTSVLARLILVFVVRYRVSSLDSETGEGRCNYLRSLLQHLTTENKTSECPLIWRLHLQLTAALNSSSQVKSAFYQCLQHCPWVKAFYLDAAKFLPEELSEIQDLIIEKEIRLHTMPEELEILRD